MILPVLYSFVRCPYAIRARLAVQISGFSCNLREVLLRDKPVALIAASSKGTVPVLVLPDGEVVDQSLDIMLYVLAINDPMNWLDEGIKTQALDLIGATESLFKPHLDLYKYASRAENPKPQYHRSMALEFLQGLETRLLAHPFLFGHEMSLADAAILPFVRQFAQTDRQWFDAQNLPRLHTWLRDFESSELRNNVMGKFKPWRFGDNNIIFPEPL